MYKLIAMLSLLLVSNHVSASAVVIDTPAFKGSSAEHNTKSSKSDSKGPKKQNSKKQGNKNQHAVVDYSHIEFAANPFDAKTFKSYEHDNKYRKQQDESFLKPHHDVDHKPRPINFDEFKREHHGSDDHDSGWELHDRKHDYFGDKFEHGYCDKPNFLNIYKQFKTF